MGDNATIKSKDNPEEQYLLLKVDGGKDSSIGPTVVTASRKWRTFYAYNGSKLSFWSAFVTSCWITGVVFGISFLLYSLSMGAFQRHYLFMEKCNTSSAANNVYLHNVVPRGSLVPFAQYKEFLTSLAEKYSSLNFYVIFLYDDTYSHLPRGLKHGLNYPFVIHNNVKFDEITKKATEKFQKDFTNVKITVQSFTSYMSLLPIQMKWRLFPQADLLFYMRAYAVGMYGGISMDLKAFGSQYNEHRSRNHRIDSILMQHNKGINIDEYIEALNTIDKDEELNTLNYFFGLLNSFINETRFMFNKTIPYPFVIEAEGIEPPSKYHRNKSDVLGEPATPNNETEIDGKLVRPYGENFNKTTHDDVNKAVTQEKELTLNISALKSNHTDPPVSFYYGLSIYSDNLDSSSFLSQMFSSDLGSPFKTDAPKSMKKQKYPLLLDSEGLFIAASSRYHPLLGQILASADAKESPKCIINNAFLAFCSEDTMGRLEEYCSYVYIL